MNISPLDTLSPQQSRLALVLGALTLWAAVSVGAYYGFLRDAARCDFCSIWTSPRLLVTQGMTLYTDETNRAAQILEQGAPFPANENQQWLVYPAIVVPLLLPYWFVPDMRIAAAALVGMTAVLFAGTLWLARRAGLRIPVWAMTLIMLSAFPVTVLFTTQTMAIPTFALAVGWLAYRERRDWLAGAILPVALIKPELSLFAVGAIAAVAVARQRWKVIGGLAISSMVLFGLSLLMAGWWVERWLLRISEYSTRVHARSTWPPLTVFESGPLAMIGVAAVIAAVIALLRRDDDSLLAASVPLGLLILPQTMPYALGVLVLPMALSWRGRARWGVAALAMVSWFLLAGYAALDSVVWWQWQMVIAPLLALLVLAFATREQPIPDFTTDIDSPL